MKMSTKTKTMKKWGGEVGESDDEKERDPGLGMGMDMKLVPHLSDSFEQDLTPTRRSPSYPGPRTTQQRGQL